VDQRLNAVEASFVGVWGGRVKKGDVYPRFKEGKRAVWRKFEREGERGDLSLYMRE